MNCENLLLGEEKRFGGKILIFPAIQIAHFLCNPLPQISPLPECFFSLLLSVMGTKVADLNSILVCRKWPDSPICTEHDFAA